MDERIDLAGTDSKSTRTISAKPWVEIYSDEKIERMREQVKLLEQKIFYISRDYSRLLDAFTEHIHMDGRIVRPINMYSVKQSNKWHGQEPKSDPRQVYF